MGECDVPNDDAGDEDEDRDDVIKRRCRRRPLRDSRRRGNHQRGEGGEREGDGEGEEREFAGANQGKWSVIVSS